MAAINRRILEKIEKRSKGDQNVLGFLRELVVFEANGSGKYKQKYSELLEDYVSKDKVKGQ